MDNIKNFEDFLDRMQGLLDSAKKQGHIIVRVEDLENTFPELAESEDEKIRKAIHIYLDWLDGRKDYAPKGKYTIKDMISWLKKHGEPVEINPTEFDTRLQALIGKFDSLPKEELIGSLSFWLNVVQNDGTYKADEKQDKQNPCETCSSPRLNCQNFPCERKKNFKPANKVEPKFKVGDWITNGDYTWKIVEVKPLDYILQSQDGNIVDDTISYVDEQFHSFTIEDAKDGDVLACESGWTCIFKTLVNDETFSSYCFMDNTKWFCETGSEAHTLKEEFVKAYNGKIYPATKEQRDLLFQRMREAGYEWDADKKELNKIEDEEYNGEDYGIDSLYHAQRILEKTLGKVDGYQTDDGILEHKCAITAIKKLYEQKPAEWSEKDKDNIQRALYYVDYYQTHEADTKEAEECFDWLKSLKPQNHWKPTEPQLVSLTIACDRKDRVGFELTQLLKELKKL